MARWVLKPVELARAAKRLGVKEPVSVKLFRGWWAGEYDPYPLHVLWVNRDINNTWEESPSWTIWHELGHALQCERDFGGDGSAYETAMGVLYAALVDEDGNPILDGLTWDEWLQLYNDIPFEKEANDIADRYSDRYSLATIRG